MLFEVKEKILLGNCGMCPIMFEARDFKTLSEGKDTVCHARKEGVLTSSTLASSSVLR